jgi:hypothetical protein
MFSLYILIGIRFSATVILFSINASTAIAAPISTWTYPKNGTTWQAGLTNAGADTYNAKFDMSVSINPAATQALVGIQIMNSVFLFSYTPKTLTLVTSVGNGQGTGFGKGVVWLSDALKSIAILANVYSASYVWSSSQIYIYNSPLTSSSTPISIFPNIQQPLYSFMSPVFLNIITTPTDLRGKVPNCPIAFEFIFWPKIGDHKTRIILRGFGPLGL